MARRKDWGAWKDIQRAMDHDGIHLSERLLREAAFDWEARREWPVIRALIHDARQKGMRVSQLLHER